MWDFSISDRSEFGNLGQMYENTCLKVFNFLQAKLLFSCTVVVFFSKKYCQIKYCLFVWNMRFPDSIQKHVWHISDLTLLPSLWQLTSCEEFFLQKTLKHLSSSEVTYILDLDHIHSVSRISVFLGACSHTSIISVPNGQVNQPWDIAVVGEHLLQTSIPWTLKGLFDFLFLLKWSNIRNKTIEITTHLYYFLLLILVRIVLCSPTKTLNWSRKTFSSTTVVIFLKSRGKLNFAILKKVFENWDYVVF